MRDRLIELLADCQHEYDKECIAAISSKRPFRSEFAAFADHLLANGVIVPPCKVGETVYVPAIHAKCIISFVITHIVIWEEEIVVCGDSDMEWSFDCFGKTVFLTREEAEKALAERSKP